jgi:hypothetical protein
MLDSAEAVLRRRPIPLLVSLKHDDAKRPALGTRPGTDEAVESGLLTITNQQGPHLARRHQGHSDLSEHEYVQHDLKPRACEGKGQEGKRRLLGLSARNRLALVDAVPEAPRQASGARLPTILPLPGRTTEGLEKHRWPFCACRRTFKAPFTFSPPALRSSPSPSFPPTSGSLLPPSQLPSPCEDSSKVRMSLYVSPWPCAFHRITHSLAVTDPDARWTKEPSTWATLFLKYGNIIGDERNRDGAEGGWGCDEGAVGVPLPSPDPWLRGRCRCAPPPFRRGCDCQGVAGGS